MADEFDFLEFKTADRLPSPSGTALAIMKLLNQDDVSLHKVAQLVQTDPALCGRLLSFVNSAAFGARRPVVDIRDAVVLIGMNAVSNFALSLSLVGKHKQGRCEGFDYEAYWAKSLLLGVSISAIMMRDRTAPPEEAFTLGLLADVGRLALATAWPELYGQCLGETDENQLRSREQELFATDHDLLTLMLLKDWGLPPVFIDALNQSRMGVHADMPVTRTTRFANKLIFADQVTQYCLASETGRSALLPNLQITATDYDLDAENLPKFIDEVLLQWREWGKLIGIETEIPQSKSETIALDEPDLLALELLLVDDDPMLLASLNKQLSKAGHRVHSCRNGESALQYAVEHNIQMLITDWHMKPMDGLALCKSLRATAFGRNLYIIMLTASEMEESLVEAYDAGIDDYVTKPVALRVLQARIRAGQRIIALQQQVVLEREELERSSNELVVSNRRLQLMANTDLLTGLANRRYTLTRLEQEWEAAKRYNRPFSVLMMDLDHFKNINDTLGHDVGDQVLVHTANVIRGTIRASDVACRIGGEEFFVIATNTDLAAGALLAERIRSCVETQQIKDINLKRPQTVSIGVAASMGSRPGWAELMKLADQALYQVKHSTRNAVKVASY
jgi:two-component system, cell cycle response regulator